jgi:prepilin-type processing-associated H-X9-DG protein
MKQLGLAVHNYVGVKKAFPFTNDDPTGLNRSGTSWPQQLFPYLGQAGTASGPIAVTTPIITLICPSDGRAQCTLAGVGEGGVLNWGLTHYIAVTAPSTDHWDHKNVDAIFVRSAHGHVGTTFAFDMQRTKVRNVTDGLTTSLLFGERPPSPDSGWGVWGYEHLDSCLGASNSWIVCYSQDQNGNPCPTGPQYFQPQIKAGNPCDTHHYWSKHPGGGNWVFGDGSVRFLAYSAGATVIPLMATKAGGEIVPPDDFGS